MRAVTGGMTLDARTLAAALRYAARQLDQRNPTDTDSPVSALAVAFGEVADGLTAQTYPETAPTPRAAPAAAPGGTDIRPGAKRPRTAPEGGTAREVVDRARAAGGWSVSLVCDALRALAPELPVPALFDATERAAAVAEAVARDRAEVVRVTCAALRGTGTGASFRRVMEEAARRLDAQGTKSRADAFRLARVWTVGTLRAYLAHLPAGAVVLTPAPDHSYADAGFGVATVERYDDGTFGAPKAVGVAPDGKRYRVAVVVR